MLPIAGSNKLPANKPWPSANVPSLPNMFIAPEFIEPELDDELLEDDELELLLEDELELLEEELEELELEELLDDEPVPPDEVPPLEVLPPHAAKVTVRTPALISFANGTWLNELRFKAISAPNVIRFFMTICW